MTLINPRGIYHLMTNTASFSYPLGILSATAFTFTANAHGNSLQTITGDDGKTRVRIEKKEKQQPEQQNWAIHFDCRQRTC